MTKAKPDPQTGKRRPPKFNPNHPANDPKRRAAYIAKLRMTNPSTMKATDPARYKKWLKSQQDASPTGVKESDEPEDDLHKEAKRRKWTASLKRGAAWYEVYAPGKTAYSINFPDVHALMLDWSGFPYEFVLSPEDKALFPTVYAPNAFGTIEALYDPSYARDVQRLAPPKGVGIDNDAGVVLVLAAVGTPNRAAQVRALLDKFNLVVLPTTNYVVVVGFCAYSLAGQANGAGGDATKIMQLLEDKFSAATPTKQIVLAVGQERNKALIVAVQDTATGKPSVSKMYRWKADSYAFEDLLTKNPMAAAFPRSALLKAFDEAPIDALPRPRDWAAEGKVEAVRRLSVEVEVLSASLRALEEREVRVALLDRDQTVQQHGWAVLRYVDTGFDGVMARGNEHYVCAQMKLRGTLSKLVGADLFMDRRKATGAAREFVAPLVSKIKSVKQLLRYTPDQVIEDAAEVKVLFNVNLAPEAVAFIDAKSIVRSAYHGGSRRMLEVGQRIAASGNVFIVDVWEAKFRFVLMYEALKKKFVVTKASIHESLKSMHVAIKNINEQVASSESPNIWDELVAELDTKSMPLVDIVHRLNTPAPVSEMTYVVTKWYDDGTVDVEPRNGEGVASRLTSAPKRRRDGSVGGGVVSSTLLPPMPSSSACTVDLVSDDEDDGDDDDVVVVSKSLRRRLVAMDEEEEEEEAKYDVETCAYVSGGVVLSDDEEDEDSYYAAAAAAASSSSAAAATAGGATGGRLAPQNAADEAEMVKRAIEQSLREFRKEG